MKSVNKWTFTAFAVISVVITILTIIASFQSRRGDEVIILQTVTMVYVFAAFVILMIIGLFLWKPRKTVYSFGFYVLHIGLVLFLSGGFLYWAAGDALHVNVAIDPDNIAHGRIRRFSDDNIAHEYVDLGFDIGVAEYDIEYYDPDIYGDEAIGMRRRIGATLILADEGTWGEYDFVYIGVNHPVRRNGWKIYLMSVDADNMFVHLMFKNDPGEIMSLIGAWSIIIGTVMMCLIRKRMKGDDVVEGEGDAA